MKDALQQLDLKCAGTECGFELADASGEYFPAIVLLKDKTLHVYSERVTIPGAIRYAWGEFPLAGVFNADGFPMEPFRAEVGD
ncbi:MAG: hypothetical protein WDZ72_05000 [Cyclobacteriaceae bacterium]